MPSWRGVPDIGRHALHTHADRIVDHDNGLLFPSIVDTHSLKPRRGRQRRLPADDIR